MTVSHVRAGEGDCRWVVGDTYTFKATGASTGGALALLEASVPPGSGPPPHVHSREDEAFYVLAGALEISTEEESFAAHAGDFVFVPRGTPHHFTNIGVDAARALILLTPGGFERFFQEIGVPACPGQRPPALGADELRRIIGLAPRYGAQILVPAGGPIPVEPDQDLARRLFAAVDSMEASAFADFLTDEATLVFGNGEPLTGREAIVAGVEAFFSSIGGLQHRIVREWQVGQETVVETTVAYHRLDGRSVCLPAVSIWRTRDDGLINEYRIFVDLTPVYS